jgi:transposase-like protein
MEDYPETLMDFEAKFGTEEACRNYLLQLRWPDGFRCSQCGKEKAWLTGRLLMHCASCGHQVSATAGTIFEGTRKPLRLWFRAMWWVTSQKNGASAKGLQQILGLGSYQTAWTWLHKLRRAMVRPGRDRLSGVVEVDETYVGGYEVGAIGRGAQRKTLVAIAVEKKGRQLGRARMKPIERASAQHLEAFVQSSIELGSTVCTDAWRGYNGLAKLEYIHNRIIQKNYQENASELLPGVHRIASLLKRWLLGTHQGSVSPQHLEYYLDEFTFRFNRRTSRHRGKLFYRLMEQAVAIESTSYKQIVRHN